MVGTSTTIQTRVIQTKNDKFKNLFENGFDENKEFFRERRL
jgi:hypothetical protein